MKPKSQSIIALLLGFICPLFGQNEADSVSIRVQNDFENVDSIKVFNKADTLTLPIDNKFTHLSAISLQEAEADSAIPESKYQKSSVIVSRDSIEAQVDYEARDSIIYDMVNQKVFLYGDAKVNYEDIELRAYFIELDWSNNQITADTDTDSLGNQIDYTYFSDKGQEYRAKKIIYNYQTQKGKVYKARTQEGEGYIHGETVKKMEDGVWYGRKGKYTTCNLDEPHFHIQANKIKMVPGKVMVTGPANLVIEQIPTPLYLPFGIFPIDAQKKSGVLLPEYGEEGSRGFFLRNGGFFFAFSDYYNLELRGDIYSSGSYAIRANNRYNKRYKYNGAVRLDYGRNRLGEPLSPDFTVSNDFRVVWQHQQDAKARPGHRFTADVNFGTSSYDRNFSNTAQRIQNNNLRSNVSYNRSWRGTPFSFSLDASHYQNLNTGNIEVTLPSMNFSVARINPFKSKSATGKKKWYENIGFAYNLRAKNQATGVDSTFFDMRTFDNMQYGVQHNIPINTSFTVAKFLNIEPRFDYTERWYFKSIDKEWDPTVRYVYEGDSIVDTLQGQIVTDTLQGFKAARDFNFSLNMSTRLYGIVNFKSKKIKAIRHVFTPRISLNYRPDFGTPFWGNYKEVQQNEAGDIQRYSIYQGHALYGQPPDGMRAGIGLNLDNNLEMKVASKKDTVKGEQNIKLLENFSVSTFYDFAKDSLNLDPIQIRAFTTIANKVRINFSTTLDPYGRDAENRRINTSRWAQDKRFVRMTTTSLALNTSFRSKQGNRDEDLDRLLMWTHPTDYYDFTVPWSFTLGYNVSVTKGVPEDPDQLDFPRNSVDMNMDLSLTPKWKIAVNSGFDFNRMEVTTTNINIVRDLHCWVLNISYTPFPVERQFYSIQLNVKSSVLQDLKLSRKRERFDSVF
ncbi:MAG: putative LPS assembly protein LptD [Chitinophagales bacterium]